MLMETIRLPGGSRSIVAIEEQGNRITDDSFSGNTVPLEKAMLGNRVSHGIFVARDRVCFFRAFFPLDSATWAPETVRLIEEDRAVEAHLGLHARELTSIGDDDLMQLAKSWLAKAVPASVHAL